MVRVQQILSNKYIDKAQLDAFLRRTFELSEINVRVSYSWFLNTHTYFITSSKKNITSSQSRGSYQRYSMQGHYQIAF